MRSLNTLSTLTLFALLGSTLECTRAQLIPAPEADPATKDDRVSVEGDFCTTSPETLNFPVKVLFVVDRSQSMNVTDPDVNVAPVGAPPLMQANRVRALLAAIDTLSGTVGVEFAIIGFGAAITTETEKCDTYTPTRTHCEEGFTTSVAEARNGALRTGNPGGGNTDFSGVLSTAYTMLFKDMSNLSEQDAGNAHYVVVFLSDGLIDLAATSDTNASVNDTLDNIMDLKKRFHLRGLQFNTALLSQGISSQEFYDRARAAMQLMAQRGNGVFRDFRNGGSINFLTFDVTSYRRVFTLKTLLVSNLNAKPSLKDDATDSDGDGLTDAEEALIGTDPRLVDTDGDHFSDLLEHRLRTSGLDPLDPSDADCALDVDQKDSDGDGLRDCEERYLGTRPKKFDSDFDGIPDYPEVVFDTLPTVDDTLADLDFDGTRNGEEVRWHSDPRSNDSGNLAALGYRYTLTEQGLNSHSQYCYTFKVANIRLAGVLGSNGNLAGVNHIMIYETEVPLDDPGDVALYRVGCVTARYLASQDIKSPANGRLHLTQSDLHDPLAFDPSVHCLGY